MEKSVNEGKQGMREGRKEGGLKWTKIASN